MNDIATLIKGAARRSWENDQRATYLWSGGAEGHIVDLTSLSGHRFTPTLLLRINMAGSPGNRIYPLIYGSIDGELAIVASQSRPGNIAGWYEILRKATRLQIQIATQAFEATWRAASQTELPAIWQCMTSVFPPYEKDRLSRTPPIPLILLAPGAATAPFHKQAQDKA